MFAIFLHVRAADMVVDTIQPLYFLGSGCGQRIVKDEDILPGFARQRCDALLVMAMLKSSVNLRQWMV